MASIKITIPSVALFCCLGTSVVAQDMKVAVPKVLAHQLKDQGIVDLIRAQRVDLNNDGHREWIVQGGCAAVGNCSTQVFRETENGYQQLLGDEAQTFKVVKRRSYGYQNIVFRLHESAYSATFSTYQFDGQQYRLEQCANHNYGFKDQRVASISESVLRSPDVDLSPA